MEKVAEWLEETIAGTQYGKSGARVYYIIFSVLLLAAASLYFLLNSPA